MIEISVDITVTKLNALLQPYTYPEGYKMKMRGKVGKVYYWMGTALGYNKKRLGLYGQICFQIF